MGPAAQDALPALKDALRDPDTDVRSTAIAALARIGPTARIAVPDLLERLGRGDAPIYPLPEGEISDPLSQAMALTAIVIGLAVTALLLALVLSVVRAYSSRELDEVAGEEARRDAALERQEAREHDEEEAAAL